MKAFVIVTLVLSGLTIFAFYMLSLKKKQLEDMKVLFADLQGVSGFDNIIKVIVQKITTSAEVRGFLKRSTDGEHLEGDLKSKDGKGESKKISISILEPSAPINAFYNLKPCGYRRKLEADQVLAAISGWDTTFIPVSMRGEGKCWKLNNCTDKTCDCFKKSYKTCWLRSDLNFRGETLTTPREKASRCLSCRCFLPVGVFAVKGGNPHEINDYLRYTFSGLVKGSLLFDQAVDSSTRDPLTNLFNKRVLLDSLVEMCALHKRGKRTVSFCMFDIDHFKTFNDAYGHPDGDKLLKELSSLLASAVRQSDVCARYGGEEFAIIFPDTDKGTAFGVTEKFRAKVEAHQFLADRKPSVRQVTISMGIAAFPTDADSPDELIEMADKALYYSKRTRNTLTAYSRAVAAKG